MEYGKMSGWSRIKAVVTRVLADHQEHSYGELKAAVLAEDAALLTSHNTLSSVLYHMMKGDSRLIRPRKETYQYLAEEPPRSGGEAEELLDRVDALVREFEEGLAAPSYEMSEREFARRKRNYQLSRELRAVIARYRK